MTPNDKPWIWNAELCNMLGAYLSYNIDRKARRLWGPEGLKKNKKQDLHFKRDVPQHRYDKSTYIYNVHDYSASKAHAAAYCGCQLR